MKVSELEGAELDYWVWRACGGPHITGMAPMYSTDWAHGGPLIEKYNIDLRKSDELWCAEVYEFVDGIHELTPEYDAPTPLIAICRAVVRSVFWEMDHA